MPRYRGTTAQRGLGAAHQADRKRLLAQHRDGDPCWRCGQPMYKWQKLDRDHIVDRALGGTDGPAVLAHQSCNRAAGARLSNQVRPQSTMTSTDAGRDTICKTCGKRYWYAARACVICGGHYHPYRSQQRSCGRTCGVVLQRRNKIANGWAPKAKPPPKVRPPCAVCGKPSNKGGRFCGTICAGLAKSTERPAVSIAYYTCRYCGELGVTRTIGTRREVCPARACQLARLAANNLRIRKGLSKEAADAQMAAVVGYGDWQQARQW